MKKLISNTIYLVLGIILFIGSCVSISLYQEIRLISEQVDSIDVTITKGYCEEYSNLNNVEAKYIEGKKYIKLEEGYVLEDVIKEDCSR